MGRREGTTRRGDTVDAPDFRVTVRGSAVGVWRYPAEAPRPGSRRQESGPEGSEPSPDEASRSPSLLMLHGLRGTHHGLELLAGALPERDVLVPDLPGFGDSGPMTSDRHDSAGYARAVVELLGQLRSSVGEVDLLGHSFGSVVAAAVAAEAPELVRRLVLVNPIASSEFHGSARLLVPVTSLYYRLAAAMPERWGRWLLANRGIVLAMSRALLRSRDPRVRRFVHDSHLRHFSSFHSPALVAETHRSSITDSVGEHVARLSTPTLVVAGETDEIAPLRRQRELVRRLPSGRLRVLDEVGHLVHYEAAGEAAREIRTFLDEP
ncbi:alpha/beta hydrolase [Actinopolyspora mortivallis]|uniref:Alpha/beta hydrolase n=1 Tax=Actinopolyspora mortivallis TaxID=33906 RepID=A0A2T0GXD7_ACTMO|nr:alpha/beta hydrolase [Actinopolyspora mortivallis]